MPVLTHSHHASTPTPCCGRDWLCAVGRQPRIMNLSSSSQMKEVRRQLERQGFKARKTPGGHWRIEHPDMDGPVFAPDTPSDHRGMKNLHAMLRRKMRSPTTH